MFLTELDLKKQPMKEVYAYWKIDENTQAFTGHAVALYADDSYLDDPEQTIPCIERLQLYAWSLNRFEKSPLIIVFFYFIFCFSPLKFFRLK